MSPKINRNAGFGLVEFMVSIGIVILMIAVIVPSQSRYTDGLALSNLADEVSLMITQAQAYGVGVREFAPGSSEFSAAYGLAFSLLSSGSPTAHIYFADRNANRVYDGDWGCAVGGTSECLGKTNFYRGNYISAICIFRYIGGAQCGIGRTDVSFIRPKIEPQLVFFNLGGQSIDLPNTIGAKIKFSSPAGAVRSVTVYKTGQITVQ